MAPINKFKANMKQKTYIKQSENDNYYLFKVEITCASSYYRTIAIYKWLP